MPHHKQAVNHVSHMPLKCRAMHGALLAVCLGLPPQPATAARDDMTVAAIEACRQIREHADRLACYDRIASSDAFPGAARAGAPQTAVTTDEARFGYKDIRAREEREAELAGKALSELVDTVVDIRKRPDGALVITLDNGQVWVAKSVERFFRVQAGDRVKIRSAAMGSFLMSAAGNRSTRVTRIQ